jgi:hypothetical protein
MKKIAIITILYLFVISMSSTVFAEVAIDPQMTKVTATQPSIAIIPYINSTEENKGYIQEIINSKYTEQYSNKNFQLIPLVDVQKALNNAGYNISNMELPDKDILASVAKNTNADYVIAMEISQLITTRHLSFFQTKVVTKAKLRYKFYNAEQDKVVSFQAIGSSENKSSFGDVGYKDPITKALNQAMDDANEKIMSNI